MFLPGLQLGEAIAELDGVAMGLCFATSVGQELSSYLFVGLSDGDDLTIHQRDGLAPGLGAGKLLLQALVQPGEPRR